MCDPMTMAVISTGLSIAGTVGGYMQEEAAADAQDEMAKNNEINARAAAVSEQKMLTTRETQEQDASNKEKLAMQRDAVRKVAEAQNISSANGVSGLSVDSMITDLKRQELERQQTADNNVSMTIADLQAQKAQTGYAYVDRVNSVSKGTHPSGLGLLTGIGGAVVNGVTTYATLKTAQTKSNAKSGAGG